MNWTAVHQFLPTLLRGDAVGEHALRIRQQQRARGRVAEIFVDVINEETADETQHIDDVDRYVHPGTTLFSYHMAQASRCADVLLERDEPLALHFHNLTPVDLLAGWDPTAACLLLDAHHQLDTLIDRALIGICDSEYNAIQLHARGLADTHVVCLPVEPPVDTAVRDHGPPTVLFVGRVAPNKALHDLIVSVALLRDRIPEVRLRLVGPPTSDSYSSALAGLVEDLDLTDTVTFAGRVSPSELSEAYASADVFCCLSDHEGFGVPLLEAMSHGVPVVAYDCTAVGETVGPAGLLLGDKACELTATALERVLTDPVLAGRMRAAGLSRAGEFTPARCDEEMERALEAAWQCAAAR